MAQNEWWLRGRKLSLNDVNVGPANADCRRTNQDAVTGKMLRGRGRNVLKAIAPLPYQLFQAKHLRKVKMGAP